MYAESPRHRWRDGDEDFGAGCVLAVIIGLMLWIVLLIAAAVWLRLM